MMWFHHDKDAKPWSAVMTATRDCLKAITMTREQLEADKKTTERLLRDTKLANGSK